MERAAELLVFLLIINHGINIWALQITDRITERSARSSIATLSSSPPKRIWYPEGRTSIKSDGIMRVKPKTAPLVDSTLLRFLSESQIAIEKMKSPCMEEIIEEKDIPLETDIDAHTESNLNEKITNAQNIISSTNILEKSSSVLNDEGTQSGFQTSVPLYDVVEDSIEWFTDFKSHKVAERLISMGVSETAAFEAGNAVQAYALARTTRQRIRKFIRDRDNDLESYVEINENENEITDESNRIKSFRDESPILIPENNVDEVIRVLSQAGLTGKDITAIFFHTPSISMMKTSNASSTEGETIESILNRAYYGLLCTSLKLRKCDARKVLRTCPGLLTKKGSLSAEEIINILLSLGVSASSFSRDKKSIPILLSRSPAALFRLIVFLSGDAVKMPLANIGSLIRQSKCADLLDRVAPLPISITNRLQQNAVKSYDDIFQMDTSTMKILLNGADDCVETEISNTYNKMHDSAIFLRSQVGIRDVRKIISAHPAVLLMNLKEQITSIFDFFCDEIGMDEEDVPLIIQAYPAVLSSDLKQMQNVVEYFISLGVLDEALPIIFRAFPALLVLEQAKMDDVVEFLRSVGVSNIGRFVTRLPPVLSYSVKDELEPKWIFLTKLCSDATFEIVRFPAFFSYPLHKVIINRYKYLLVKGLPAGLLPVDEVVRYGDVDFATKVAGDPDSTTYAKFVRRRMKRKGSNGVKRIK